MNTPSSPPLPSLVPWTSLASLLGTELAFSCRDHCAVVPSPGTEMGQTTPSQFQQGCDPGHGDGSRMGVGLKPRQSEPVLGLC